MGDVVAWRGNPNGGGKNVRTAILIVMGAWAMMFFSLLFAFVFIRLTAEQWPPPGTPPLPRLEGGLALVFALASAVVQADGVRALRMGRLRPLPWAELVALLFALIFVGLQATALTELRAQRFTGSYGIVVLTALAMHLLCTVIGLLGLLVVTPRAFKAHYTAARFAGPASWALYWGFIALTWAIFYPVLYWL